MNTPAASESGFAVEEEIANVVGREMKTLILIVGLVLPLFLGCVSPEANRLDNEEINRRVSESIIHRQEAEDIARTPGFETTTKSGREVLRIATEYARRNGSDLTNYRSPTISLIRKDGRLKWLVSWDSKGMPIPGGFFGVLIDDETGVIANVPGM